MPGVERIGYLSRDFQEKSKVYFKTVTVSNQAFGLFLLKYYREIPANVKKFTRDQEGGKQRKEKLSGKKLNQATQDYNHCFMHIYLLRQKINPPDTPLAKDIQEHYIQFTETKFKEKKGRKPYSNTNSLELAIRSLPL